MAECSPIQRTSMGRFICYGWVLERRNKGSASRCAKALRNCVTETSSLSSSTPREPPMSGRPGEYACSSSRLFFSELEEGRQREDEDHCDEEFMANKELKSQGIDRRTFIKGAVAGSAALAAGLPSLSGETSTSTAQPYAELRNLPP